MEMYLLVVWLCFGIVLWIKYDHAGKIKIVATYDNGLKDGKWYIVGEDSVKEITYQSNKILKVEEVEGTELSFI